MLDVIKSVSESSIRRFDGAAPKLFIRDYQKRAAHGQLSGTLRKRTGVAVHLFERAEYRPSLTTLFRIAVGTDVSLLSILEEPADAAKVARLEPHFSVRIVPSPRPFRKKVEKGEMHSALTAALHENLSGNPVALAAVCRRSGASVEKAQLWFPALSRKIIEARAKLLKQHREKLISEAEKYVRTLGVPRYRSGHWRTQKAVVDALARRTRIPKCLLRRELQAQLRAQRAPSSLRPS